LRVIQSRRHDRDSALAAGECCGLNLRKAIEVIDEHLERVGALDLARIALQSDAQAVDASRISVAKTLLERSDYLAEKIPRLERKGGQGGWHLAAALGSRIARRAATHEQRPADLPLAGASASY